MEGIGTGSACDNPCVIDSHYKFRRERDWRTEIGYSDGLEKHIIRRMQQSEVSGLMQLLQPRVMPPNMKCSALSINLLAACCPKQG